MTIPSNLTLVDTIKTKPWQGSYTILIYKDPIGNFINFMKPADPERE